MNVKITAACHKVIGGDPIGCAQIHWLIADFQARGGVIDPVQRKCLLNADEPATVLAMLPAMYGDEQRAAA